ncbi:MAG: hypothetical protein KC478_01710 [Bacteriovoracaceae bacterium]|nr:hypothetical protein [Bacteriovoracaceae bacterium]
MNQTKINLVELQNHVDTWTKAQLASARNEVKKFLPKDFSKASLLDHLDKNAFMDVFFAHKAIKHGASEKMSFQNLKLLGRKLMNDSTKEKALTAIEKNVIKFKGEFVKLDDLHQQDLAHKAIKTMNFETTHITKAA